MNQVRTILLGLLSRGPQYGYQIKKTLQQEQFVEWATVPVASLYHQLTKMADEDLIERVGVEAVDGRPARTSYGITEKGRQALSEALAAAWLDVERARSPQDVATLFLDTLPEEAILALLRQRLDHLDHELDRIQQVASARGAEPGARPSVAAVYAHFRLQLQGEIDWTRDLIGRIESGEFRRSGAEPVAFDASLPVATRAVPSGRTTPGLGAFTFVLHSHLPYCRMAGRWPHGEEWIHEAASETYVPLLNALYDLVEEGIDFKLTISLTPVLTEQLADRDIREHFMIYLEDKLAAAARDIPRFGEEEDAQRAFLAQYYVDFFAHIRDTFLNRFGGDIVGAFRRLQDDGYVEIITCGATHGYLPLLSRDASIYAQLRAGVESYRRHFGRSPRAIWLPECAYRPAYLNDEGCVRPAIEQFLANLGITCFFVETHAIEGGRPVGKAAGDVAIGPYGAIVRRYTLPVVHAAFTGGTTYRPYHVVGSQEGLTNPPVSVIGRNNRTGQQVWSGDWGYPGDADYREFHKKDHESGMQYWRVTGPRVDLGGKDVYHPDWADYKVGEHARHYASLVEQLIGEYAAEKENYGLVASNYDAELFGHWWFEGIEWIKRVLRTLASSETVDLVTASGYLETHPPQEAMAVPESSWGAGGNHWTWDNPDTHWMWAPIHEAERRMEGLVAMAGEPSEGRRAALNQAARELLLAQSSDWPFLVTTGQAKQYAIERFQSHLSRFQRLADLIGEGRDDEGQRLAAELYERDKVFPRIDYRWFAERQGRAD